MCKMTAVQLASAHTGEKSKFLHRAKEGFRAMECMVPGGRRGGWGALAEAANRGAGFRETALPCGTIYFQEHCLPWCPVPHLGP